MKTRKKICFVASSGGHWEEIMCLKSIAAQNDAFFITESGGQIADINMSNTYILKQINRKERFFIINLIKVFIKALKILKQEKPDIIITTGALVSFPFCLVGKCLGKKIIYIESFARVHEKSLTGRLVYPFADLFIVQWESMRKHYPKAKYGGTLF